MRQPVVYYANAGDGAEKMSKADHAARVIREYDPRRRRSLIFLAQKEGRWVHVDWAIVAESLVVSE